MAVVVGREDELGAVEAFVGEVGGGPIALVLAGEAGIGKTVLWEAGVEHAERCLGRVLTCRGVEAESSLSFAGLSELLAPVLADTLESLAPPRRRALEVALLLEEPGGLISDPHAIGLAVLDVLGMLAVQGPMLVAIDDLQWLDPASAGVLQVALRRLREEPVKLLIAVRESPEVSVPIDLERCFTEARLRRLRLGPLSLGALHHLLGERLGLDLSRPDLVRVNDVTAGNAFFALELGRELARLGTRLQPGEPFPVPSNLAQLLRMRLARLSTETRKVLLIAALAGRPTIEVVSAAHGDANAVLVAIDEAVQAGVVEFSGDRVRLSHPLLASVLYEHASSEQRRDVHRALAGVVSDVEERARHRARAAAGPDATVAAELDTAAEQAAARGATAGAAELCELAVELTPDDAALARQRRLRAARFHRLAGDGARAVTLLERLLAETSPGLERCDVLFELAMSGARGTGSWLGTGAPLTIIEQLNQALTEADGDDARAVWILAQRAGINLWLADARSALVDAREALARAERVGDPVLLAMTIARTGLAESYAVEITPGLLERGVEIEDRHGLVLEYYESPRHEFSRLLVQLGELERPRDILEAMGEAAIARGDEGTRLMVTWRLGMLEWLAGRWPQALDHVTAARELVEQTQHPHGRSWVGRVKALVEADLGLVDQARASAQEGLAYAQAAANEFFTVTALGSLGRVELALGNHQAASGYLSELPERLHVGGIDDPTIPLWADTIETLVALGERDQARVYLEQYEVNAERLASPWAVAAAARCRGLFAAGEGDLVGAVAAAERALTGLAGLAYPFERGRALLVLGSVLRQAQHKERARATLEQALTIFEELGAGLWAAKARSQLARISGRRPPDVQLTETERQVATLAGDGRSNKQIAAALYMGVSTVEAHLSRVYRKLGVPRAGLAARLTEPFDSAVNPVDTATQT